MRKKRTPKEGPAKIWTKRIELANELWDDWDKTYRGSVNENYYLGHQHENPTDSAGRLKYTINLCFPSVEIKMPALLFNKPHITVIPRPGIEDDPNSNFDVLSERLRDLVLTCISLEQSGFSDDVPLAVQETFYRFGVIEVGLSTNPAENPNADQLDVELPGDPDDDDGPDDEETAEAPEPKVNQLVYYKHIPADQVRVSANSRTNLRNADWIGYYETLNVEDIKANPYYEADARKEVEATHVMKGGKDNTEDDKRQEGMAKVWTIWCNRTRMKYTFADGKEKYLKAVPFKGTPKLAMLSFHPILKSPYPCPPMYNWLSPQDELNETREMQRVHRRRGTRRYLSRKNILSAEQKDMLRSSEDGILLEVEDPNNTIFPMLDAPLDRAVVTNVPLTKDDFRNISGVSGEQTGEADSPTATQANIVNINSLSRDNYYKSKVAKWLSRIFKLTVEVLREEAAVPIWIKANVDVDSPTAMQESALVFKEWQKLSTSDLGTFDFDVHVSIDSLNDQGTMKERQDWMTFLGTVFGPQAPTILAMSPPLLKKTMNLYGIKNGKDIQNIQAAVEQIAKMQAIAAGQAAGEKAGKATPGTGPAGGANASTPPPGPNTQAMNVAQLDRH